MSAMKLLSAAVLSVAALAGPSAAQQATPWPATCICKPADPRGANLRYVRFQVDDRNLALLKARFAEIGNAPMQKTISVPNGCADPKMCLDRKQVVADEATIVLQVMGLAGDPDLFDDSNVLQLDKLKAGVPLVLYGPRQ